MTIIEEIIAMEWRAFRLVRNEGGRASCQDDYATFEIMRKSQFLCWDPQTLVSYCADLDVAQRSGRNLVQEKYARMMASTAPERYATFAHTLPQLSDWQRGAIKTIVAQQVAWREDFAAEYPALSSQARLIRTEQDTPTGTSFETYLRGELGTYSAATLLAYEQMIALWALRHRNMTTAAMNHTAVLYGYKDVADAERKLQNMQAA
ncbi:DUF4125 family protein [Uliginosibacterium sp. H3]|uniref:DUF4125 family protein n=1 Tax=Uliginosibacterium silvisoli TaxID=3114758 RepID=A0ABU6K2A0_9RHOO|nr:DUF4125 family protein [Uliginosibacterium sp. H3]